MSSNDINALRAHLFETLAALKDTEHPMEIERAKAVTLVAAEIIDSARVEVEFSRVTGQTSGSGFLPAPATEPPPQHHRHGGPRWARHYPQVARLSMSATITTLVPDDALLFEVAREAIAQGVQIISNGRRFALATTPPPGWHAVPVGFKTSHQEHAQ